MKRFFFLAIFFSLTFCFAQAQVGINILIPDSSAVLQLEADDKGLGLTRLTSPQRDAISNPLKGLTIYNTQDSVIEYWNGECWLKVYQKNCYECEFTINISQSGDTLDRTVSDSVTATISVTQTNGTQDISIIFLASLPQGITAYFNGNPTIDSAGSVDIVVKADMCAPVGGNFPIVVQALCGDMIHFVTYNVYVRPPVAITVPVDQLNYNLQALNNLPTSPAQFVVLQINNNVELKSTTTTTPAYNTGNLDPNSLVCVVNNGAILGRGGDGGSFTFNGNLLVAGGEGGHAGGHAMNLTTRTILQNNGAVFGGGSGGGSAGFALGTPSIPIIGAIVIGFGFGGGGGSESGKGGVINQGGGVSIGLFGNGTDATCCINSVPGVGASSTYPISIPISVASINITPSAYGGNGGAFGQQGARGYIDVQLEVCVSVPIIGNICVPIPIPGGFLPFYGPNSGPAGWAIKRNNNPLIGLPDNTYNTSQVKGTVGN